MKMSCPRYAVAALIGTLLLGGCGTGGPSAASGTTPAPAPAPTPSTYLLTTTVSGSGVVTSAPSGISCGAACSASFASGSSVTLTATPASGYAFSGWTGNCSGTGSCVLVMSGARSVTATFAATPPTSVTYYFSDCQTGAAVSCVAGNNANAGTSSGTPKRDWTGINFNTLPAGTRLLFARGGAFAWSQLILDNPNTSAAQPLTFDAYGAGPLPILDTPGNGILFGMYNNTNNDGGYVFRNLHLQGRDTNASYGFFFMHNVRDVVIESMEITDFYFGIQSQANAPYGVTNVTLRNNIIRHNHGMGILGQFSDTLIEGNTIEENNFSGSGFEHGTYLSGNPPLNGVDDNSGRNLTIRNNRYIRNSVNGTRCTGGNMTFHGRMDNVLIEGNHIEQDAGWQSPSTDPAGGGCWLMSITQGWESSRGSEALTRFVVRNNKLINGGNTSIASNSAPGILIEGNVMINQQPTPQTAVGLGHGFDYHPSDIVNGLYPNGDIGDGNAIVRNNTACQGTGAYGSFLSDNSPNTTQSNNVVITGAAATTGICAR